MDRQPSPPCNPQANTLHLLQRPMFMFACAALVPPSYIVCPPASKEARALHKSGKVDEREAAAWQSGHRSDAAVATTSFRLDAAVWNHVMSRLVSSDAAHRSCAAASLRRYLLATFGRNDIRARLLALGIDTEEARDRVIALSDEDIAALSAWTDEVPEGVGDYVPRPLIEALARPLAAALDVPAGLMLSVFGISCAESAEALAG